MSGVEAVESSEIKNNSSCSLWNLQKNETGCIQGFLNLPKKYESRLKEMGLDLSTTISCEHLVPFGMAKVFCVSGFFVSLTKELASKVLIKK